MTIVTHMDELFVWQDAMDAEAATLVAEVLAAHPRGNPDLTNRPLKLLNAKDNGTCDECREAKFTVQDKASGRTAEVCRACINAVRRQSLHHKQYNRQYICMDCDILLDSVGIIHMAIHHTKPLEDQIVRVDQCPGPADNPDCAHGLRAHTRLGAGPLIRAGRIDLTDGKLTILAAELV